MFTLLLQIMILSLNKLFCFSFVSYILFIPIVSVSLAILNVGIPSTLVIFSIIFLILMCRFYFRPFLIRLKLNISVCFIFLYYIAFLLYLFSVPHEVVFIKFANITVLILIPIFSLIPFCYNCNYNNTRLLNNYILYATIICTSIFTIIYFLFKIPSIDGRFVLLGYENPIWIGRYFGISFIIMFVCFSSNWKKNLFLKLIISLCCFILLYITCTRGPLLFCFLTIMVWFLFNKKYLQLFLMFLFILFVCALTFLIFEQSYFVDGEYYSLSRRLDSYLFVVNNSNFIFGNGFESFGFNYLNEYVRYYPHNLFLEIYYEIGCLSFFIIFTFIVAFFKFNYNCVITYITIYLFLNAMISGDIVGNSSFFISFFASCLKQS